MPSDAMDGLHGEGRRRRHWYTLNGQPRLTPQERRREVERMRQEQDEERLRLEQETETIGEQEAAQASDLPRYRYHRHGRIWAVYRYERTPHGETGTLVSTCLRMEDARREACRLNSIFSI